MLRGENRINFAYLTLFKCFQSLKEIDIEFQVFVRPHGRSKNRVIEPRTTKALPESIEKITLRYKDDDVKDFGVVLVEMCKRKEQRLPNLKHLHFQRPEGRDPPWDPFVEPEEFRGVTCDFPSVPKERFFSASELMLCRRVGVTLTSD